ncbi:MAG: IS3 family transposase [Gammaproteobacteria bacterium]
MATVSRGGTRDRFRFIQRYGQDLGVSYLCDWLNVSRSGYYAFIGRPESQHTLDDKKLTAKIIEIHRDSREVYGSPRIHKTLQREGVSVGKKRVERLMRSQGLQGRVARVTRRQPSLKGFRERGDNLRLNSPDANTINQVWVADITYLKVRDTYRFLTVVMDIYSRRILSWSLTSDRTTKETAIVLKRAAQERLPATGLIFHTDRGSEFTGSVFRKVLQKYQMKASVNRLGYCTDNGHMESFFHSLKTELIRGRKFNSMPELRYALNSYINHFYNKKRLHSGIGYCSPIEYEKLAA